MIGGNIMDAEKEAKELRLREWLAKNKENFRNRPIDNIGELALLCGSCAGHVFWDLDSISAVLPEWHVDSLTRTTFRLRQAYFVDRELKSAAQFAGQLDLGQQWY